MSAGKPKRRLRHSSGRVRCPSAAEQLEQVAGCAHQFPLGPDLVQATQAEAAEAALFLDLAEDRFDDGFAHLVNRSSRSYDDVAFRFLSADEHPDHSTLAEFRKRHLKALSGLFLQALQLCAKAGLVKLGHVAIDGTKIKANASKHKAMSYARMGETEQRLQQEIDALLQQAEDTDAAEDALHGKGRRGDELPDELSRRDSRLKKIQQAKAELEKQAEEKAEQQRAEAEAKRAARRQQEQQTGKKPRGRKPKVPAPEQAQPEAKAQRNFTDGDSRIIPDGANKGSFLQNYNAQAAVDSAAQVIVAAEITQETNDNRQLLPILEQLEANLGRKPDAVSADAGYWSEANATNEKGAGIDLHIATGRRKHDPTMETESGPLPDQATAKQAMQHKLRTEVLAWILREL
jgi:Transposase DDE domain